MNVHSKPSGHDALADSLCAIAVAEAQSRDASVPQASLAALRLVASRLFAAVQGGDTCVRLEDLVAAASASSTAALRDRLLASGAVALVTATTTAPPRLPICVDEAGHVSLLRHFLAEWRTAQFFANAAMETRTPTPEALAALRALLPKDQSVDHQLAAVAVALHRRVSVITGGPGTGKTTTILKLLSVLLREDHKLRVALVAPTGKAAQRMELARSKALAEQPDAAIARATTLHRLLGYSPSEDRFRRNERDRVPFDLVVVDEASMVDLDLFDALLRALPTSCRIALLGDRDQLTSVGAGQLLADLCDVAKPELGMGPISAQQCKATLDMELKPQAGGSPLAECVTMLTKTYRFDSASGIGAFASAIARRDRNAAIAALDGGGSDLALKPCKTLRDALQSKLEKLRACTEATSPQEVLKALQTVRILCAQYSGPFGVEAVNAWVESHLRDRAAPPDALLQGRPVLITTNDYASGLMNGDLGVLWPDANNRMLAWFDNGEKEPRGVLPQRLPPHETAWAMTVHKSQGSEFDEVIVFLPETDSPLSSMQWLYTAITRAKKVCTVFGDRAAAEHAIRSETERRSGLASQILRALGSVAQPTS